MEIAVGKDEGERQALVTPAQKKLMEQTEMYLLSSSGASLETPPMPAILGIFDSAAFLLGYTILAVGANAYMSMSNYGPACWYYVINALLSIVGLFGLAMSSATLMFIYGGYLCASFLVGSMFAGSAVMLLLQADVCHAVGTVIASQEIVEFCTADPLRFQIIAITTVFSELLLEAFVIWQLHRVHRFTSSCASSQQNKLPLGKLGSIAILK